MLRILVNYSNFSIKTLMRKLKIFLKKVCCLRTARLLEYSSLKSKFANTTPNSCINHQNHLSILIFQINIFRKFETKNEFYQQDKFHPQFISILISKATILTISNSQYFHLIYQTPAPISTIFFLHRIFNFSHSVSTKTKTNFPSVLLMFSHKLWWFNDNLQGSFVYMHSL